MRAMLDNETISVNVRKSILPVTEAMETLPNPFEVVNTHLWRNVAYLLGIVPFVFTFYTPPRERTLGPNASLTAEARGIGIGE